MPDFSYVALANSGQRNIGTLSAGNEREAAAVLDSRGLFPIEIKSTQPRSGFSFGGGVSGSHLAALYAQLADLMRAGVPLLRSLELLERQTSNKRLASTLRDVRMKVADGTNLADAMSKFPKVFSELAVSMIRAGQEGGFLEDVLKRIAMFVEHQQELKAKVVGALAYPVFLAVAGTAIVGVLITVFVPQFEDIFDKMRAKGSLPFLTESLLSLSNFLTSWVGVASVLAILAGLVWFVVWTRGAGRAWADRVKLKLPLFGKVFLSLALARFTRILGTMLQNGIPILRALAIAKDSTGNKVLAKAIEKSAENISAGQKLADPLRRSGYFPNDVVEMIAIAEEANSLETVLVDIAEGMEKRTTRNLELSVKLLEPMMLMVMAGIVLVTVLALLMPIFKMSETVQ